MRIGIHNEPLEGGIGGAEISVARLAGALAWHHSVEIVHHKQSITREKLGEYSGADLVSVGLRYVEAEPYSFGTSHLPWRRYREARRWRESLSAPYDLFISFVHGVPAFCHAPHGVLAVLFPLAEPEGVAMPSSAWTPIGLLKRAYHRWVWKQRLSGYQQRVAISTFATDWARRRWYIDCEVIYPPVDTHVDPHEKSDFILSVGRFATQGHSKHQLEMLDAFNAISASLPTWEYFSVGGVEDSAPGQAYFAKARAMAQNHRIHVDANVDRARLTQLYQRSKVFWHAAGFGEDEATHPERSEHFGIVTVEAMAAGCIPIVINKGGQREIVEHGVSGFLWNTLDELQQYTLRVARDEQLRKRMADASQVRSQTFSTETFLSGFRRIVAAEMNTPTDGEG